MRNTILFSIKLRLRYLSRRNSYLIGKVPLCMVSVQCGIYKLNYKMSYQRKLKVHLLDFYMDFGRDYRMLILNKSIGYDKLVIIISSFIAIEVICKSGTPVEHEWNIKKTSKVLNHRKNSYHPKLQLQIVNNPNKI